MGCPVDCPSNTPDRISTVSGSRRWVVYLFCPGLRRSNQCWIASAVTGMPGGTPSTVAPRAGPWLSPHVVTRKRWPKLFTDICGLLCAWVVLTLAGALSQAELPCRAHWAALGKQLPRGACKG